MRLLFKVGLVLCACVGYAQYVMPDTLTHGYEPGWWVGAGWLGVVGIVYLTWRA